LNVAIICSQVRSDDRIRQQLKVKFGKEETMDKVKFAIGMIVSHSKKYKEEEKHYGVIIGWHCEHNSTFVRTFINWFRSPYTSYLCIRETEDIIDQPCYMILSENHKMCYVQQGMKRDLQHFLNNIFSIRMIFTFTMYIFYFRSYIDMSNKIDQ